MSSKYPIIADLISKYEGSLNSVNRGRAGDTPGGAITLIGRNLTDITVQDILDLQANRVFNAAGRFQIIRGTFKGAVNHLEKTYPNIRSALFNEPTQILFFDYLLDVKKASVGSYIRGESNNLTRAAQALAEEFAVVGVTFSAPNPLTGQIMPVGSTLYGGTGGNKAFISPQEIQNALVAQRRAGPGSSAGYIPLSYGQSGGFDTQRPVRTAEDITNNIDAVRNDIRQRASKNNDSSKTESSCNCGVFTGYKYEFSVIYKKTEQAINPNTNQLRRDWLYLQLVGNLTDDVKEDRILIYLK